MRTDVYPENSAPGAALEPSRSGWLSRKLRDPHVAVRLSLVFLAALYLRTIAYGFVYDDLAIVFVQWKGWKALGPLFLQDLFASPQGPGSSYYRPLPNVLGLIYIHWTGGTPGWFHLEALAILLVVFYLAYVLGRYVYRSEWMALLTALLFCLHPSKVEAVAWIGSSLCDGMGSIFFFASLICYFKWSESGSKASLFGSVALYMASLFTKETLAVLPGLVAIHFWLTAENRGTRLRRAFVLLLPYAVVLAGYFVMRHIALTPHVAATSVVTPYLKPSFTATNVWTAPLACWWYLKHLVLPTGLSVMYDSIIVTTPTLANFVIPAIALLVSIGIGAWLLWRNRSLGTTFMAAFFVLTMAPYIVLAPMSQQHDRYLYLAAYPFSALIAWLVLKPSRTTTTVRYSLGCAVILLWALSSWHETGFWADNLSLWQRADVIAPSEIRPKYVLADEYMQAGEREAARHTIDEGLRLHPDSTYLLHARGAFLESSGDLPGAKASFQKEFANDKVGNIKPIAAFKIGNVAMKQQDYAEAEHWYRTAVNLVPAAPGYHGALAKALRAQGREAEAQEQDRLQSETSAALRNSANSL